MIRVNILYPQAEGVFFDWDYYLSVHMPLAISLLKPAGMVDVVVEKGLASANPEQSMPYVALCHFTFHSVEQFMQAFLPHAQTLQDDIAKYTNSQAVIQFSEIQTIALGA